MKKIGIILLMSLIIILGISNICVADMIDLTVEEAELVPKFNKDTIEYTCTLQHDIDKISIVPEVDDKGSKIDIIGNSNLKEGENIVAIKTTEAGQEKIYIIKVIKNSNYADKQNEIIKSLAKSKNTNMLLILIIVIYTLGIAVVILLYKKEKELLKSTVENRVTMHFDDEDE